MLIQHYKYPTSLIFSICLIMTSCIDPVEPEFEFEENLVFIEGLVSTKVGASFVALNISLFEFGKYRTVPVEGATIDFENLDTGQKVLLRMADVQYVPSEDFLVKVGETWKLNIQLPNGKKYTSPPERVPPVVPINELDVTYETELEYRELQGGRFIPGHSMYVSFDDPPDQENYYYWTYRTLEDVDICQTCFDGQVFREGKCIDYSIFSPRQDYICEVPCWRIRYPEKITIYADEFSNGKNVSKLPIGNLPLYNYENMVVEVQQFSINRKAYEYYMVVKDLTENNRGINAPPPAALVGNMFNPDDKEDFVLGQFTVASASMVSSFIERRAITERILEPVQPRILEDSLSAPMPIVIFAPCKESRFRTAIPPSGWLE